MILKLIALCFIIFVIGFVCGESMLKRYLAMKAEGPGSQSFKMFGKWYVIQKENSEES